MRRPLLALGLAAALVQLSTSVAWAARPVHDKFIVDETNQINICGIPVMAHTQVKGNVIGFEGHVKDVSLVRETWTNADGDWLQLFIAGPFDVYEELDGDILTTTLHYVGVAEQLRSSEGLTAVFDRGLVIIQDVVDLNDLNDPNDDVFISGQILFEAGPHPELDSGSSASRHRRSWLRPDTRLRSGSRLAGRPTWRRLRHRQAIRAAAPDTPCPVAGAPQSRPQGACSNPFLLGPSGPSQRSLWT